jgi:hypothetical protein
MDDLIKALTIMKEYITDEYNKKYPTHCEHAELYVAADPAGIPSDTLKELEDLGFIPDEDTEMMKSYKFGSC